jgi:hypothetical protein
MINNLFPKIQGDSQGIQNYPPNQLIIQYNLHNHYLSTNLGIICRFDGINLNDNIMFGYPPKFFLTYPLMSKHTTSMTPNQHWSTLNPALLFCPTSKVELLNRIVSSRVNNIVPNPASFEKHLLDHASPLH